MGGGSLGLAQSGSIYPDDQLPHENAKGRIPAMGRRVSGKRGSASMPMTFVNVLTRGLEIDHHSIRQTLLFRFSALTSALPWSPRKHVETGGFHRTSVNEARLSKAASPLPAQKPSYSVTAKWSSNVSPDTVFNGIGVSKQSRIFLRMSGVNGHHPFRADRCGHPLKVANMRMSRAMHDIKLYVPPYAPLP